MFHLGFWLGFINGTIGCAVVFVMFTLLFRKKAKKDEKENSCGK